MDKMAPTAGQEAVRTATRPAILFILLMGALYMIVNGIEGIWATAWISTALAGAGEWILERPILKVAGKA